MESHDVRSDRPNLELCGIPIGIQATQNQVVTDLLDGGNAGQPARVDRFEVLDGKWRWDSRQNFFDSG
jgi:hypothetical protein